MNKPADNVVRGKFWTRDAVRDVPHPNPVRSEMSSGHDVAVMSSGDLGDSVSADCFRVLELPQSFRYRVRFERIPAYDLHAKGFFVNMDRSWLVTILRDDSENAIDTAYLETVEPLDGEVFRILVDEFVTYVHDTGDIADSEEKEFFLYEAMSAHGIALEFRNKGEFDEVSSTVVTETNFDSFVPEDMSVTEATPLTEGTEKGFPTVAYFRGSPITDELQMDISPDVFKDPSRVTVLHLMMHVLDTFNQEGWEIPENTVLVIQKKPFVREGSVCVPFRYIRESVLKAMERSFPLYLGITDEEERIRKFFNAYLLSELAG